MFKAGINTFTRIMEPQYIRFLNIKGRDIADPVLWNQIFIYHNNLISFTGTHRKTPSVFGGAVSVERDRTAVGAAATA